LERLWKDTISEGVENTGQTAGEIRYLNGKYAETLRKDYVVAIQLEDTPRFPKEL